MSSVEPMSHITIKVETVDEDEEPKEAFDNNGLKNQSTRKQVSHWFDNLIFDFLIVFNERLSSV